jgi:hypothetical protein
MRKTKIMNKSIPISGASLLLMLTATTFGQITSDEVIPGVRMNVDAARTHFLQTNDQTNFNEREGIITRVYGKAFAHGTNAVDSATNFISAHANMFGIESNELLPIGPNADGTHALPMGHDKLTGTNGSPWSPGRRPWTASPSSTAVSASSSATSLVSQLFSFRTRWLTCATTTAASRAPDLRPRS